MDIIIIFLFLIVSAMIITKAIKADSGKQQSTNTSSLSNNTGLGAFETNFQSSELTAIQKQLDMLAKIPKDSQTEKGKYLLFDT